MVIPELLHWKMANQELRLLQRITYILIAFNLVWNSYNAVAAAQEVTVDSSTSTTEQLGPVITITCVFQFNTFDYVVWYFTPESMPTTIISEGTSVTNANLTSRYNATQDGHILTIRNALQSDEGRYSCRVVFEDGTHKDSGNTEVEVSSYLPDPEFPKCKLEPLATPFTVGSNATFTCNAGDSNPPVNIQHELQKPSDSEEFILSNENEYTKTITAEDNNATFTCIMLSNKFPTAPERRCTSGPISVEPLPMSSTTETTVLTTSGVVLIPATSSLKTNTGDNQGAIIGGSIGGVIGILILILIFIFVVFPRIKRLKRTRTSDRLIGRMVDLETKDLSKPRPVISDPVGPVAFNQTSVDLGSTDTLNHDYAFANDTQEESSPGVTKESRDQQDAVEFHAANGSVSRQSKLNGRKIKGISKLRPEISAPFGSITVHQRLIDLPNSKTASPNNNLTDSSIEIKHVNESEIKRKPNGNIASVPEQSSVIDNGDTTKVSDTNHNDIPAYARADELPPTETTSPFPETPIYGQVNKDQTPIYGKVQKDRKKGRSDPLVRRSTHVYESADELEQSEDESTSPKPISAFKPPPLYDRVNKGSQNNLNVTGSSLEDNSGYASADEIDAHCRRPQPNRSRDNVIGSKIEDTSGYASADEIDAEYRKPSANIQNNSNKTSDLPDNGGPCTLKTDSVYNEETETSEPPVYSEVKKNNKVEPDEAKISSPSVDDETSNNEAPVYSEVKKKPKGDDTYNLDRRQSEGFVENTIYLSSQRKSKAESDA